MSSNRFQPALLGGLFIGILSTIPIVSAGNACCCLWVIAGGLLAVYMRQQQPAPVETSDAVLSGLIAGCVGAVLTMIGNWALMPATAPILQERFTSMFDANPDFPAPIRDAVLSALNGRGWGFVLFQFGVTLPIYAVFSMLGALLGLAFFRKKTPPPAPPV
jgi:hypothetical protein